MNVKEPNAESAAENGGIPHAIRIDEANLTLELLAAAIPVDGYRLRYHLMPPAGWMNDPNGLIYYRGEYHVFYQHYPYKPIHGPMYWGHAKSRDLVHWQHLPVALAPSETYDLGQQGGYGCWSGSAVDDEGVLTLIYTGHVDGRRPEEVQCLARSEDGIRFGKDPANPVLEGAPTGAAGFRDPKVWKHDGRWYMILGSGKEGRGEALLYASPDLLEWSPLGTVAESDGTLGDMWECPDLFPLGDKGEHVLIFSPMNMGATKTMYLTGQMDYGNGRFSRRYGERLDYGFDFYAPQTFLDGSGRRILIGWMNIWGAAMPEQEEGWMGACTLPRELLLAEDGSLRMKPVEELKVLRGTHFGTGPLTIGPDETVPAGTRGNALELKAVFDAGASGQAVEFGLRVRCSEDGEEFTEISYSPDSGKLTVDRSRSGRGEGGVCEAQLLPMEDGRVELHVFLDRSSLEVFANEGRKTMTNRIYPDNSSLGIHLFARKGEAVLERLDLWELRLRERDGAME
ncbi:glycoside hydrolase family 32 protein [Paenibacillus mucilaginosus]|uniref:Sucrose-6-phosphate hydrolase n=1 Tax=Paenibacillus mucilaginosus (strain KNP414) TaxID=1036673 RepID=F8FRH2_PAEMK|nr:glycoside hydrolase family 32 protein [Paenibacillus mucilaginosus]AEI40529.1 sucrose-6-phosphate hydrolase [Paenibacillus mucilaginosus KNP414]MCG7216329.1 glycoside hydrolase family 32 protein [Paenibacillus mucilaginosus]WDM29697.1 glycoside hydrolase family 32 protein [Paenibacillus mucilaginosus]